MTEKPTSLRERFVSQFLLDREAGRCRSLEEYLAMFPGDSDAIAEEYSELRRGGSRGRRSPADQIGHYHLIRELGRGGQAIIYLAEDTRIRGRRVAVKVLTDPTVLAEGAQERFQREAEVASKLEHPGICPVYEAGVDHGRPFIV